MYGFAYSVLWTGILMALSLRAFRQFVVVKEGVRRK
jgi:hypothetical protein